MVTDRLAPVRGGGGTPHQIWVPYHFGGNGLVTGDSANDLLGITLDPNVLIQESKVGTCDIRPGRRPSGPALLELVAEYRGRADLLGGTYPAIVTTGPRAGKAEGDPTPRPTHEGS